MSDLDCSTWSCICDRLRCEIILDESSSRYGSDTGSLAGNIEAVQYDRNSPLNGMISKLRRECGGSVYAKGVMTILSIGDLNNPCYGITDDNYSGTFFTRKVPYSWICLDFHEK
jgi:hypothetical protein